MTHTIQLDRAECEAAVRRLWPFLDGTLAESERARVVTHLEQCADCRSHYDYAEAFLRAVALVHRPDDVTGLRTRVLTALAREGFDL